MLPNKPLMRLKDNLKQLMEAKGLRASQVSRLSGVPSQRLCDWLAGAQVRNVDQLKKVCEVLGVTIDAILFSELTQTVNNDNSSVADIEDEQIFMVKIKKIKG